MGRAPCCDKNGVKKGPWTPEEDQRLIDYIQKNGYGNWRKLPQNAGLERCGKSCRLRWTNYLRPDIKRGRFSLEEEETIIQLHSILGNKWSTIAAQLPGRTDNEIKNYWNTRIRKRLMGMGIDPVTHNTRLDLSIVLDTCQTNLSMLLGMQSLINPELLKLATSLFSSQGLNQDYVMQNHIISCNPQFANQVMQNQVQDSTRPTTLLEANEAQNQLMQYDDVNLFQQDLCEFGQINDCGSVPSTTTEERVPLTNYGYDYWSGCSRVGPSLSSEASNFQFNDSSNNLSYGSVLSNISTHSSSPTQLNSNHMSSNKNDNERESYCSNMLKFEIPNTPDFNDYV